MFDFGALTGHKVVVDGFTLSVLLSAARILLEDNPGCPFLKESVEAGEVAMFGSPLPEELFKE